MKKVLITCAMFVLSAVGVAGLVHAQERPTKPTKVPPTTSATTSSSEESDPPGWPVPPCAPNCLK